MLKLLPMGNESYGKFIEHEIKDYAEEKVKSGNWRAEDASSLAEKEFKRLLPDGLNTKDQYLRSIVEDANGEEIGTLWYGIIKEGQGNLPGAFIWDFFINEEHRGKGYGKESLKLLEEELRNRGIERVSLHAFGHNKKAISLYEKSGFEITNIVMSKRIPKS